MGLEPTVRGHASVDGVEHVRGPAEGQIEGAAAQAEHLAPGHVDAAEGPLEVLGRGLEGAQEVVSSHRGHVIVVSRLQGEEGQGGERIQGVRPQVPAAERLDGRAQGGALGRRPVHDGAHPPGHVGLAGVGRVELVPVEGFARDREVGAQQLLGAQRAVGEMGLDAQGGGVARGVGVALAEGGHEGRAVGVEDDAGGRVHHPGQVVPGQVLRPERLRGVAGQIGRPVVARRHAWAGARCRSRRWCRSRSA